MATKKRSHKTSRPKPVGWNTTDADEIARRVVRAETEPFKIKTADADKSVFSDWLVIGASSAAYRVEFRAMNSAINSCGCKDFQVNRLGTCKHIEAVRRKFASRKRSELEQGHARVEIYLDRRDNTVNVSFPERMRKHTRARQVVTGFFDAAGKLRGDPLQSMAVLQGKLSDETARVRRQVRISPHLEQWLLKLQQAADLRTARRRFEQSLQRGGASLDVTKLPLYPYQQEGMLHLAFTGRALLADEMGLGKTVQAIAASELLHRLHSIDTVLVVSPASLKSEWLEQIGKFSDRRALIIQGMRRRRYQLYQKPAFYYLANYEQMLHDKDYINDELKPDLIILDEAQRIKNWQTKTAAAIKQLQSPYAFVLTGTPLENRIDEIYSITQFLDPELLGPLFRFNREFHQLDDRGVAVGYKNLDRLHERLRPIMLRRRKDDVEGELPERSLKNYFVQLNGAQQEQYAEHEVTVAQLAQLAKKRPLTKEQRQLLMMSLACMRMACDTPYILDKKTRLSPKLDELEKLLEEWLADPACKIIVFSEWERMLTLLAERLNRSGIDYAWHTGSVTQKRRREEINRFKNSPDCRLFLATDSAATGLNLQVARVVVNLDLPWNPAKLEQRIARAWRKHQKQPVAVLNLISENTIEHRMLDVLQHKTGLAEEVVDGAGNITAMDISAGRGSFMQRLDDLLAEAAPPRSPLQQFTQNLVVDHADRINHLEQRGDAILAVVDKVDSELANHFNQRLQEHHGANPPQLELLDRATFEILQRLAAAGVIQFTHPPDEQVYDAQSDSNKAAHEQQRRQALSRKHLKAAAEKQRMSQLLANGGFISEALPPLSEALNQALTAAAVAGGTANGDTLSIAQIGELQTAYKLPADTVATTAALRHESAGLGEQAAKDTIQSATEILRVIEVALSE